MPWVSRLQKGEAIVGAPWRDLKNIGADYTLDDEWILLHTRFNFGARNVIGIVEIKAEVVILNPPLHDG